MTGPLLHSSLLAPLFSTAEMRAVLDDRARLQRMLDFEAALVRAEAAVGIVPSSHLGIIAEACRAELYDLAALGEAAVPAGNLAIPLIDALTTEVGKRSKKAAGYVHWGSTSQDVIDTATVLELRAVIDALLADLDRATKAFITLSGRHRRNMTVARTLLQQALPMPFGLKLAGYAAALARSRDRLRRLRKDALVLQFGGAAGTLAALDEKGLDVSERLAALLDLTVPDAPWHSHRDRFAEVAAALAILAGSCGKIARDVALLMQSEVGEVSEASAPDRGGSSTLPHMRNPVSAAAALSAAMIAPNLAATILTAQIQEHERSVGGWQAEWVTFPALALVVSGTLRAVVEIAEGLNIDVERMKANLEATGGLVFAEAISYALAERLGRAEAHELVAEISREAAKQKRAFKDVVAENDKVKTQINAAELEKLFRPNHYQGSAQTFIDRLVASSQGRTVRRSGSVGQLIEPKMPTAKLDHLSAITAATSAIRATAAAAEAMVPATAKPEPAVIETPPLAAVETTPLAETPAPAAATVEPPALAPVDTKAPAEVVEPPTPVVVPEPQPAPVMAQQPESAPMPTTDAPPLRESEEEPGALLEVFARVEAEAETAQPSPARDDRKTA